jgi:hypothetical protein
MKAPVRKALGLSLALSAGLLLPSLQLTGCMTDDDANGSENGIDPFPRPNGPRMIPLDTSFRAGFHYTELDREGRVVQRIPELSLYIIRQAADTFGYAFERPERGLLIRYLESANRDSSGIWIVGSYRDGLRFTDSTPVRWLPQFPEVGKTWEVGAGRTMELIAPDAEYLTDVILRDDTAAAPIVQGMQRHSAYRFKETAGDTISYYFFRKGVGLLGYERSAGGKLIAAGSIRSFHPIRNP